MTVKSAKYLPQVSSYLLNKHWTLVFMLAYGITDLVEYL